MLIELALVAVACFFGVAILALLMARRAAASPVVYVLCLAFSLALLAIATTRLLTSAPPAELVLPLGVPWIGSHFRLDVLSAFFLVVINLGGSFASLYAIGYGAHEKLPQRVLPFVPAYLAGMNLVVLAADAFSFLVAWEFMSLSSWALVLVHHHDPESRRAGYVYLVMASLGTLVLLLAFGLLAGASGAYAFDAIRAAAHPGWLAGLVLVLVLIGTGSKAGLVPLHVWLPLAHPAAPSHVSGLMSGVMTKVAIYGFIRIAFDLLGAPAAWWSLPLLLVGGLTAVMGILQANLQSDLKRLLAYSTIENIGVVFIGLGLALAFRANNMNFPAALAFTAALFHVLNHSLFKNLLFFGAGAVQNATGERDIEKLGGLIHRMPRTTFAMLGGALAISALPPLNGFVSEWLAFQAILLSPQLPQWGLELAVPAVGVALALSAELSAACFIRMLGIGFLGRPRSAVVGSAQETDRWSLAAMLGLLALCLAAGILPGLVIDWIAPVAKLIIGARMPVQIATPWLSIVPIADSRSSYNGLLVFLFIIISALLAAEFIHRFGSRVSRRSAAWDCGFPDASPATQYTASSFAQPVRRTLASVAYRVRERLEMPRPGERAPARFSLELTDRIWTMLYQPTVRMLGFAADHIDQVHYLTIRGYLGLVFAALVGLLLVVAIWR